MARGLLHPGLISAYTPQGAVSFADRTESRELRSSYWICSSLWDVDRPFTGGIPILGFPFPVLSVQWVSHDSVRGVEVVTNTILVSASCDPFFHGVTSSHQLENITSRLLLFRRPFIAELDSFFTGV